MGRKILAVVVGMIVAMAIIMIVQMANSVVVRPPTSDVMNDPARMREFWNTVPVTGYIVVLLGYLLGAFGGGFIVTKMSRRESPGNTLPILIGVLLLIFGILRIFKTRHSEVLVKTN